MPPALRGFPSAVLRGKQHKLAQKCPRFLSSSRPQPLALRRVHSPDDYKQQWSRSAETSSFDPLAEVVCYRSQTTTSAKGQRLSRVVELYLSQISKTLNDGHGSIASLHFHKKQTLQSRLRSATFQHCIDVSKGLTHGQTGSSVVTKLLAQGSYDSTHLQQWGALLLCHDHVELAALLHQASLTLRPDSQSTSASKRLKSKQPRSRKSGLKRPIPLFVLHALTARSWLEPGVIGAILDHLSIFATSEQCFRRDSSHFELDRLQERSSGFPVTSERLITLLELFSNLNFHVRQCWPSLRESVAAVFSDCLGKLSTDMLRRSSADVELIRAALGFCANSFLFVLAWPSEHEPFKNISSQESSQASVLRFMASGEPALELDRFGYRAIAMTQLMQPKTSSERTWAALKTLSWPPWKEDRTGMDASIGPEHGISRATQTLNQMSAAGYRDRAWERVARVYAGWDTDLSPTIQYRFFTHQFGDSDRGHNMWTARIRTTRTLREAWAGFLAYQDAAKNLHPMVCSAMLEKILREVWRQKAVRAGQDISMSDYEDDQQQSILPGDALEIWSPPPSAHLETYTRTDPPSLVEFLNFMSKNCVDMSDSSLGFLLSMTPDMQSGKDLLSYSQDLTCVFDVRWLWTSVVQNAVPQELLAALTTFFLQYPAQCNALMTGYLDWPLVGEWKITSPVFAFALHFLRHRPWDPTPGLLVTTALAQGRGLARSTTRLGLVDLREVLDNEADAERFQSHIDRIAAFDMALEIEQARQTHHLPLTPARLGAQLTIAATAGSSAQALLDELCSSSPSSSTHDRLRAIAEAQLAQIQTLVRPHFFASVVASRSPSHMSPPTTPRLILAPSPVVLLSAVRAFSAADDFEGLVLLTRFMRDYWAELAPRMAGDRNGARAFAGKVLVALRAGVMFGHRAVARHGEMVALGEMDAAPRGVGREIQTIVEKMRNAGHREWKWPGVEEVRAWVEVGRARAEKADLWKG